MEHLAAFLPAAVVLVITPGADFALVTKNALMYGRPAALRTSLGVCSGLAVWTVASALGVSAVLKASAIAFTVLKALGAIYLVFLGVQALWLSRRKGPDPAADLAGVPSDRKMISGLAAYRQGVLSNLLNPKIVVFFTSFLPQFIDPGQPVLVQSLLLGGVFVLLGLGWLVFYSFVATKAGATLNRPAIRRTLQRLTGCVLVAFGVRLAVERR